MRRLLVLLCMLTACNVVLGLERLPGPEGSTGAPPGTGPLTLDGGVDGATSTGKFTLSVAPTALFFDPGEQNVALRVTFARAQGFNAPVSVSVEGLPSGVRAGTLTLVEADTSATMLLAADADAAAGSKEVTVVGRAGGDSATFPLAIFITGEIASFDADASFIVPSPAPPFLDFYLWGAGGGGGGVSVQEPDLFGGPGGAGGWAGGRLALSPEARLDVRVGQGGGVSPGGGGSGGGYTSIQRGDTMLFVAGGGGGGGSGFSDGLLLSGGFGGAGGGDAGQRAGFTGGASGGIAAAGGGADTCNKAACDGILPLAGAALSGGAGGYRDPGAVPSFTPGGVPGGGRAAAVAPSGGGGGGGWFGGGGGGYDLRSAAPSTMHGRGGGGGSGFADGSATPIRGATLITGDRQMPPLTTDPHYRPGVGVGGLGAAKDTPAVSGGKGRVAIAIAKP